MPNKYLALTMILGGLIWPMISSGAGLEVSPTKLDILVSKNGDSAAKLLVKNPNKGVEIYDVYVDEFADSIDISPTSFTLEAGEKKEILVSAPPNNESRVLQTNISIVSRPLTDYKFKAQAGIKIPLTVRYDLGQRAPSATRDYSRWLVHGLSVLIVMLLFLLTKKYYWPSKKKLIDKNNN